MKRVRYPFIVRYTSRHDGSVKFGQEGLPEGDGWNAYMHVGDQLAATVYTDLEMFKSGFHESPTAFITRVNSYFGRNSDIDLLYVGP